MIRRGLTHRHPLLVGGPKASHVTRKTVEDDGVVFVAVFFGIEATNSRETNALVHDLTDGTKTSC